MVCRLTLIKSRSWAVWHRSTELSRSIRKVKFSVMVVIAMHVLFHYLGRLPTFTKMTAMAASLGIRDLLRMIELNDSKWDPTALKKRASSKVLGEVWCT